MTRKRKARELTVSAAGRLTPNMRRLTLCGDDLADFPEDAEGAYFKLAFAGDDSERPILRTYTVARHRPERHEIDVDFMLHDGAGGTPDGVASTWAVGAQVCDHGAPVRGSGDRGAAAAGDAESGIPAPGHRSVAP